MINCPKCGKELPLQTFVDQPSIAPVYKNLEEALKLVDCLPDSETKKKLKTHIGTAMNSLGGTTVVTVSLAQAR
jgi:hypothetical protein